MHHHRTWTIACLAVALLAASAPGSAAKLYKWVDDQGNVTYSQLPPPQSGAESVELKGIEGVSSDEAQQRLDGLREKAETARKDRQFKANYSSESKQRDERLKENCEVARQNVRVLETAARIKAEDGSFIDDSQRSDRLAAAKQQVEDMCEQ